MTLAKKGEYLKDEIEISDFARSLGHPARIAILKTLAERGECVSGDIINILPLSQSTVIQHLKELKRVGLIKGRINGLKACYCIHAENFSKYSSMLISLAEELKLQTLQTGNCESPN